MSDTFASGDLLQAWRRKASSLAVGACLIAGALLIFTPTPAPAEGEEIVEGGQVFDVEADDRGMPPSNPRVKPILAAHPHEFVTICVAGCDGKPSAVQILPKPFESRVGAMRTTAGGMGPRAGRPAYGTDSDAVTCLAGCGGRPGQVVQRLPGLPPPKAPRAPERERNEPLDVR